METFIGEIIILLIVVVIGFVTLKLFGKNKRASSRMGPQNVIRGIHQGNYWGDEDETMICSSWNVSVLSPKTGKAVKTVPVSIPSDNFFSIGRDKKCSLHIDDKTVTSYHALITKDENGEYILKDSDSLNGIVCIEGNKERAYDELPLEEGLVCFLGNTPIGFSRNNARHVFGMHDNEIKKSSAHPDDDAETTKEYRNRHKRE